MRGDPGATRTPNQQNRNLSFYPLNYGTRSIPQKYNQKPGFTTNYEKNIIEIHISTEVTRSLNTVSKDEVL